MVRDSRECGSRKKIIESKVFSKVENAPVNSTDIRENSNFLINVVN